MPKSFLVRPLLIGTLVALSSTYANARDLSASLSGFNEVPPILSSGTATLKLKIDDKKGTINYTLTYSGLSSDVTQSHLHFGKVHVAGGVFVFLCTNLGNGPAGTPACPTAGGTVTGTLTAASVVPDASQAVTAGDFSGSIDILDADAAYANIHTTNFPAGEIRGQVGNGGDNDK